LFALEGKRLVISDDVVEYIVDTALKYKLGARGLRSMCEALLMDEMFESPSRDGDEVKITLDTARIKLNKFQMQAA
jgi:ATP-dependent Clp protease ATP-binding subunit ClpX